VHAFDKFKVVDGIATKGGGERLGKISKVLQVLPEVDTGNVVNDIQQCYTGTRIAGCLKIRWLKIIIKRNPFN